MQEYTDLLCGLENVYRIVHIYIYRYKYISAISVCKLFFILTPTFKPLCGKTLWIPLQKEKQVQASL